MSVTRRNFLDRVVAVQDALAQPLLIDQALTETSHNNRARILRNGLMVVTFSALEDFIRERSAEVLGYISRTALVFSDLPRDLVLAATVEVMRAAHAHAKMASRHGDDPVPLLQQAASEVASTLNGPLHISKFSLGYNGSNVGADEVGNILKTLHAGDPWNEMTRLGSRVGLGAVPLRDAYAQGLRLRNRAAHKADSNIQPSELLTFCQQAKAIALGFDLLASRAARLIHDSATSFAQVSRPKLTDAISIVFVDFDGRRYACKKENARRALKIGLDRNAIWLHAISKARVSYDAVVERDKSGTAIRWESTDCA
ncbi:HEPN domain-containing protein [Micromonospora sp. WMMA1949]|uniref:HEPN domain-containing protein n=1 Tax=Micromonospora sp. WMMA1949 TaxID=3015162 RepID=UPI0022B6D287|nr:HEPN domain-containing protein [Micromonospora sp. WMMA1949]MCZ7428074.1 HEPN domain-containing protein [Micromonospora sp. WMMA1949]